MYSNSNSNKNYRRIILFNQLNNEVQPKYGNFNALYIKKLENQKSSLNKKFERISINDNFGKLLTRLSYKKF